MHPYLLPNSWLRFLSGPTAFTSRIAYAVRDVVPKERRGYIIGETIGVNPKLSEEWKLRYLPERRT